MENRQSPTRWPTRWLMTDERFGDQLWTAIERLPAGAGVVVRDPALGIRAAALCRKLSLILAVARDPLLAAALEAELVYNPRTATGLPASRSVHNEAEAHAARAEGASLVFVSPVFATRSHPGRAALGIGEAARLAGVTKVPAIALGGMDESRFAMLKAHGFHGWAGIDAWMTPSGVRT